MAEKSENTNSSIAVQKLFFSVGPTLRYSHNNVRVFWLLTLGIYIATLMFWSKLLTGDIIAFGSNWSNPEQLWDLSRLVRKPLDIFNYPEHILILGALMAIISITPILISQLMSLRHSLVFVICSALLGLPVGFSLAILISCFAVASRPLRFRSRIISIALCVVPEIIYWAVFGSSQSAEPIRAGLSYGPWICAWLFSMLIAGAVLGLGHFTRYRPGLIFAFTLISLITTFLVFQANISLADLDFQLYVAGNDPANAREFYEQDLSKELDIMVEQVLENKTPFGFYPTEKQQLRERLKRDIQNELRWDRWLKGFKEEDKFNFQRKRNLLIEKYNNFITPKKRWWMPETIHNWLIKDKVRKKRLPVAIYYKGIVSDMEPDIRAIATDEILRFHFDYPHRGNWQIWIKLYKDFSTKPESIEARWRIAKMLAGEGNFEKAQELCDIALNMTNKLLLRDSYSNSNTQTKSFALFHDTPKTVITKDKLEDVKFRLNDLRTLISPENIGSERKYALSLATFVRLNPNTLDYNRKLERLAKLNGKDTPLSDNLQLALALIEQDYTKKQKMLKDIATKYQKTDGGIRAMYELAISKVWLWQKQPAETEADKEIKNNFLIKARELMMSFIAANPEHYLTVKAIKILDSLPESR